MNDTIQGRPPRVVLVTGCEPFDGEATNPSALVAQALDGREIAGRRVVARVLPCVFGESARRLRAALDELSPELVVCVGQAGGRGEISLERVAINVDDARIADNAGAAPVDEPVIAGGPVGYWSTLPIKACVAALRADGIPAGVSQTAGTFVCNHIFYALMDALAERGRRKRGETQGETQGEALSEARGGFVHVPFLPEQAARRGNGEPSLPLETLVRAIERVVATSFNVAAAGDADAKLAGGAIA